MPLFIDRNTIERAGALKLLKALRGQVSITLDSWIAMLEQGSDLDSLARDLAFALQQQRDRDAHTLDQLPALIESYQRQWSMLQQERQQLAQQTQQAQAEARRLHEQVSQLEFGATGHQQVLAREQQRYATEIDRLQAHIADLNRLVAEQHLQLTQQEPAMTPTQNDGE